MKLLSTSSPFTEIALLESCSARDHRVTVLQLLLRVRALVPSSGSVTSAQLLNIIVIPRVSRSHFLLHGKEQQCYRSLQQATEHLSVITDLLPLAMLYLMFTETPLFEVQAKLFCT
jgi:hypothetical protein